ncbi:TM2 domain-containing protein [bacterium]|nr:MAG: TM2 domain-containing protein [bacterium]
MTPASGYAPYSPAGGYGVPVSHRSKVAAILLAFFLGGIGIHRFYLGYTGVGVAMLLFCILTCGWGGIITGIVAIVDIILIATGSLKDAEGRPLAN